MMIEKKSFRMFISFQYHIPRVANVYYHLENGQYRLRVEEVHDVSGLLSVKNQDNPELIRQRLMHELFKIKKGLQNLFFHDILIKPWRD